MLSVWHKADVFYSAEKRIYSQLTLSRVVNKHSTVWVIDVNIMSEPTFDDYLNIQPNQPKKIKIGIAKDITERAIGLYTTKQF